MYIGQRVKVKSKGVGTIRYVGPIPGQEGCWVGIEWDNKSSGKHSGTVNGTEYFKTKIQGTASFLKKSNKIATGIGILDAIKDKYCSEVSLYSENTVLPDKIGKHGKIFAVGFSMIKQKSK
ncbi:hypothetical protein BB560_000455 [Smittium megazygosporum]|uniref:CAP-Gly domain-containing protein n=1 Tax=Smittium megazygosporum TaxID=133381 RepID=A0A2T9ZK82_9FUNG|nr:hypothetical protein BB560_000455 [Smittium megazygosporum]